MARSNFQFKKRQKELARKEKKEQKKQDKLNKKTEQSEENLDLPADEIETLSNESASSTAEEIKNSD